MDYLQYEEKYEKREPKMTFVLNLIINGLSSIHAGLLDCILSVKQSFKPYYKWIIFNTK